MSRAVLPASILCLFAATAAVAARQTPAPAIAVIGFTADSASRLSPEATGAMTEKLAVELVESGRFRVMDREWLGPEIETAPLARVRDAANAAGVDYLVVGKVSKFTERPKYAPYGSRAQPFRQPFAGYALMPVRPLSRRADYLRVSLEIVDAKSGSVLTETSSTCPVPPKPAPRTPAAMLLPVSPVAAAVAAIASARRSSSALDPGIARAVATAGHVIARWTPPDSNSR
jgi:hypothetical protein